MKKTENLVLFLFELFKILKILWIFYRNNFDLSIIGIETILRFWLELKKAQKNLFI
jgi:hypothetical protein